MSHPIIYMIRHGEKPPQDADGLSVQGLKRAEYLPNVFGRDSSYKIGYILAEKPNSDGSRARPYDTVKYVADNLGLTIDTVDRDNVKEAAAKIKAFSGPGNVLVCWEHKVLGEIAEELGAKKYGPDSGWKGHVKYPGERFDLIWVVPSPYHKITEVKSEKVPGLDDGLDQEGQK
ncbi:hypothetical protein GQ53DRAFT_740892 [Thozetella sp. PMI_491]|nr:hypothetical protein GQ53DRAFT_740892 [Thozetella sp. PMI_491]